MNITLPQTIGATVSDASLQLATAQASGSEFATPSFWNLHSSVESNGCAQREQVSGRGLRIKHQGYSRGKSDLSDRQDVLELRWS